MKKFKIPYAVMNYAQLREEGYYYVDKTRFIVELEKYQVPVFLRPRRFGKSLLCTTLDYYYDLNEAHRFEALFGDTYIGQHPTGRQSKYMVLPNNTMRTIFVDYYNTLNDLRGTADKYVSIFEHLDANGNHVTRICFDADDAESAD